MIIISVLGNFFFNKNYEKRNLYTSKVLCTVNLQFLFLMGVDGH